MRVLAQTGQRSAAVQQYVTCAVLLARDLQVEPGPETQKLLAEIKRAGAAVPDGPPAPPPLADKQRVQRAGAKVTMAVLPFACSAPAGAQVDRVKIFRT